MNIEGQFKGGAIVDRPDSRDYAYEEVAGAGEVFDWSKGYDVEKELAKKLELSSFKIPVKNQGESFSCGGQAWSYLDAVLEALATGSHEERSARYIYSQTYVPEGGGSRGRDNSEILAKQGCAYESLVRSYEDRNGDGTLDTPSEAFIRINSTIGAEARTNARQGIAKVYSQLSTHTIDSVAQAVRDNGGCVIGLNGVNNGTWTSSFPKPPALGQAREWGHWIYVGKALMIQGKKYIGILNSWGDSIGDAGWQWVGEDYFTNQQVMSVWVHSPIQSARDTVSQDTSPFNRNLKYGESSEDVKRLQVVLKSLGFFPNVPCTGVYLDITRRAVLKFQLSQRVASDKELYTLNGRLVGHNTRKALNTYV